MCQPCYRLDLATNGPVLLSVRGTPPARFMAHVDTDGPLPQHDPDLGPCWTWTAAKSDRHYGEFRVDADTVELAHRWVYAQMVGPIPAGYQVDHLCHDWRTCFGVCAHRACVNPVHLRAVEAATNNARSGSPSAQNARKVECLRGHDLLDPENVYRHPTRGTRHCRACQVERAARWEADRTRMGGAAVKRRASRAPGAGQGALFEVPSVGVEPTLDRF